MMWPKVKKGVLTRLRLRESWVIFFILGIIMMNYPFIRIFDKTYKIFEFPLLYLYLMVGWVVSIVVILMFTKAIDHRDDQDQG